MRAPARNSRWLNPAPCTTAKGMYLVGARKQEWPGKLNGACPRDPWYLPMFAATVPQVASRVVKGSSPPFGNLPHLARYRLRQGLAKILAWITSPMAKRSSGSAI